MREREFAALIQSLDQVLVVFLAHMLTRKNDRIRYPDPVIKVNDTVKINLKDGKIEDFIRFDTGVIAMVTGGRNMGRVGVITHRERHDGGFNIVHIKDAIDNSFATRETNVFVIGREKPWISLPKGKGVKVRSINIISNNRLDADGTVLAVNCGGERSSSCLCNCRPLTKLRLIPYCGRTRERELDVHVSRFIPAKRSKYLKNQHPNACHTSTASSSHCASPDPCQSLLLDIRFALRAETP